jgi:site-specific recombinase XerD
VTTIASVTWNDAVEAFIRRCEGDGLSPATIAGYRWTLTGGRLPAFRESHRVVGPAELSADILETLKHELLAAGLAPTSVGDYCRVIRVFARFCIDHGWLESSAILNVRGPRQPKHAPRAFTEDEEAQLLKACTCERDRVLVRFVIETGLRRAEVASLRVDDIVQGNAGWLIRVRNGKGGKDRVVPIGDAFARLLHRYIAKVRPQTTTRVLFLALRRNDVGDFAPLTGDGLYRIFSRLAKVTGIRAYPHRGRHTFATRLAVDGVQPWAIQGSLGHADLGMTEKYVNAAAVDLQAAFAQRKPRTSPETPAPTRFAPILVADFLQRGASTSPARRDPLPRWFMTEDDPSTDRMWLQHVYLVLCAVANHLELPRESGVLSERYGLPEDMVTALLEVAMRATVELPEDVVGEQAVEDTIAVVRGALQEAIVSE